MRVAHVVSIDYRIRAVPFAGYRSVFGLPPGTVLARLAAMLADRVEALALA